MEAAITGERLSEHPIGKAIVARADTMALSLREPERFDYSPGRGIQCAVDGDEIVIGSQTFFDELAIPTGRSGNGNRGSSYVLVAENRRFLGTVEIADTLRPEAVQAVAGFQIWDFEQSYSPATTRTLGNPLQPS